MNRLPDYRKAWHGRTWPEATHDAGWAGWRYRRDRAASRIFGWACTLGLFAGLGVILAWRM